MGLNRCTFSFLPRMRVNYGNKLRFTNAAMVYLRASTLEIKKWFGHFDAINHESCTIYAVCATHTHHGVLSYAKPKICAKIHTRAQCEEAYGKS